ncbi:MAG: hypothetical protein HYY54_03045 [candidate division NC10 bacterium]|nr:hypothetical protein [candidate division NC10 bacterium]
MFDLDASLDRIPVSSDGIERVAWSLNLTPVAGTDFAGAEARAYAIIASAGGGRSVCYVCLYVSSLDRAQVYRHRANPFSSAEGEAHEEEALEFLQELGFILESIDYRGWSSQERREWFDKQPPFRPRRPPPETPPVPKEAAAAPAAPAPRPAARAAAAVRPSPARAEEPEEVPARLRPVKVDLPEEYGDLARLLASF